MPRVPKEYDTLQAKPQAVPVVAVPDLGSSYAKAKTAQHETRDVMADYIQDEVKKGKQIAVENYKLQVDKAHAAVQNQILSKQRADAINSVQDADDLWAQQTESLGGIGLADVRDEVSAYARAKQQQLQQTALKHAQSETERLDNETRGGRIHYAMNDIALNPDSDELFEVHRNAVIQGDMEWAERYGYVTDGTKEESKAAINLVQGDVGNLYGARIQSLVDADQYKAADRSFEQAVKREDLNAEQRARLFDMLQGAKKNAFDNLFQQAVGYMEQARSEGRIPNPKRDVPQDIYAKMMELNPNKVKQLDRWRNALQSNLPVVSEVYDMWASDSPVLKNMTYGELQQRYFARVSKEDWNNIDRMWRQKHPQGGKGGASKTQQFLPIAQRYTDAYLVAKGLWKRDGTTSPAENQRRASIALKLANKMSQVSAANGKTTFNDSDMQPLADEMFRETVMVSRRFSTDKPATLAATFKNPKLIEKAYKPYEEIPTEMIDLLKKKRSRLAPEKGEITDQRAYERAYATYLMLEGPEQAAAMDKILKEAK